ncbi:uncharacterized protein LOC111043646 [Nilaparvata lugens]|uniref:uncharacterized protein LOC111043646 n=1 Tax=Nilaparvata lugens TaxID=108931 RepID=UPI00193E015F|nr:uncharacterized protein LOC111043646 [Nilaparvata lugens]
MTGLINTAALNTINLLESEQLATIKNALRKLNEAHKSYLLSEKINEALVDLLEGNELNEEISSKLRSVLCSPSDLLAVDRDEENDTCSILGLSTNISHVERDEESDTRCILGLSTNISHVESNRLNIAEDSQLFEKVHNKLLSWCSHGQTLEKVLRQLGLSDYLDQPGEALLSDNQSQVLKLRRDLSQLIDRRVALTQELQSMMQIQDDAFVDDLPTSEDTAPPSTMTVNQVIARASELERKTESWVAGLDVDMGVALKKLHQMLDEEFEAKELTRKRLAAKLAAYKQLEEETDFASILKNYLKAKSAASRWKWTLDELKTSSEINM